MFLQTDNEPDFANLTSQHTDCKPISDNHSNCPLTSQ